MKRSARAAARTQGPGEIDPDDHVVKKQQHARDNARRRDPDRHRSADELAPAGPATDDQQRPESMCGVVVMMDRAAGNFRQQIVSRGQRERREHERAEILAKPCGDHGLQRAMHGRKQQRDLHDGKHPGENEERCHRIPLRGKGESVAAGGPASTPATATAA